MNVLSNLMVSVGTLDQFKMSRYQVFSCNHILPLYIHLAQMVSSVKFLAESRQLVMKTSGRKMKHEVLLNLSRLSTSPDSLEVHLTYAKIVVDIKNINKNLKVLSSNFVCLYIVKQH